MKTSSLPSWAAVVAAFFFVFNLNLFATTEEQSISYSMSSTVMSKYLSPGMGVNLHDKTVMQSDITASWKNFTALVWASHDLEGKYGDSFGDEIDYGLLWSDSGFSAGIIYFDEPNTALTGMGFGANDIVYTFTGYTHDVGIVKVSAIWENYHVPFGGNYKGGNLFSLGVSKSFQICSVISLSLKTEMSYGDGPFGTTAGLFNRNTVDLVWGITPDVDLKLGAKIYVPMVNDYRETDAAISLGLTCRFR